MIGRIDAGNAVELFRLLGPDLQIHHVEQVRGAILVEDRTLHIHDEGEPFPVGSMAESSVGLVTGRMFPGKIRPDLELVQDLPGEPVGLGRSKKDIPAAVVGKKEACHEKMLELGRPAGPGLFACSPGRLRSGPKTEGREDRGLAGEDQWVASGPSLLVSGRMNDSR